MSSLFIDSTYNLTVGILDKDFSWLEYEVFHGQKSSMIIQATIYEKLKKHHISPKEISHLISISGPGFYTGLRLSEGLCDVFSFFGIKNHSFYSFEVPLWMGEKRGRWFTKAYRGEYFFYEWDDNISSYHLVEKKNLHSYLNQFKSSNLDLPNDEIEKIFVHNELSMDELSESLILNPLHTAELIRNHPQIIFPQIIKNGRKEPFYFRPPEDEFKVNPVIDQEKKVK